MYFTNKNKTSKIAQHFHDNLYYNISRVNFILAEKTADRKRNFFFPPPCWGTHHTVVSAHSCHGCGFLMKAAWFLCRGIFAPNNTRQRVYSSN